MNSQRGDPRPGSRDGPQASRLNHPEKEAQLHRPDCQARERTQAQRRPMTLRTHRETLTFAHPFTLSGVEDVQALGAYTVQTDEELLEGLSFLAYLRVATVIFRTPTSRWARLAAGDHGRPARTRGRVGERRIAGGSAALMSTAR